jgi:hydrogenase expression/formation protein HypE
LEARGDLALASPIESDCAPLNGLTKAMLACCPTIRAMRDVTRGGLAAVANELAEAAGLSFHLEEAAIPLREELRGFCEILGLDPLYLANEGKLCAVVPAEAAEAVLATMRALPYGRHAAQIGVVGAAEPGMVTLKTGFGGERVVDMPLGEQLPRIC